VIDAANFATRVHRHPGADGYASSADVRAEATNVPQLVPALPATLANLDLA
jgi:proteasome lid subunit RPN8/RPN11